MLKLILSMSMLVLSDLLFAQAKFDLGIKGGVNFAKISFDPDDYSAESVTKSHFGAFARVGWNRIFIQPEFYFSGKGGDVTSDVMSTVTSFDYTCMDIPVLLGFKVINGKSFDLHFVAGPVFSNITSEEISSDDLFAPSFYEDKYIALQYGLGIDILFLSFDARMENALGEMYSQPGETSGKSQTFMLSLGIKFL